MSLYRIVQLSSYLRNHHWELIKFLIKDEFYYKSNTIYLQTYYLCLSIQCLGHKSAPSQIVHCTEHNWPKGLLALLNSWPHFPEVTLLTDCFLAVSEHNGHASVGQCTQGRGPLPWGSSVLGFYNVLGKTWPDWFGLSLPASSLWFASPLWELDLYRLNFSLPSTVLSFVCFYRQSFSV